MHKRDISNFYMIYFIAEIVIIIAYLFFGGKCSHTAIDEILILLFVLFGIGGVAIGAAVGSAIGSVVPVADTAAGAAIGVLVGIAVDAVYELVTDTIIIEGQTGVEWAKDGLDWIADQIFGE